jgi:hypothetical protein
VHIAIQTDQEEIEQILTQHYASQHGFDLKKIQWEMNPDTGKIIAISVAEPRKEHAPPAPPPMKIDEEMVRRILGELFLEFNKHTPAVPANPALKPPVVAVEELPSVQAQSTPPQAQPTKPKKEPAKTKLGHVVSWLEHPDEAPHHPSDTPDKVAKRRARLMKARREAGGVLGIDDDSEKPFDPITPPPWADTEKH